MTYECGYTEKKIRLPIPVFTGDTVLTFKSVSNQNYTQAKKLLFVAKSLHKDLPKRKKKKKKDLSRNKFSIREKLKEIYLQNAKRKKARNGCFIKCNYLEELVAQEDLSYFIMKVYPSKVFLYYKNPYRIRFFYQAKIGEEYDLFDSIDNEEIPTFIFDQIIACENWDLLYDYHCFLQIQKYSFEDECAQPVYSSFVLLKPTMKLLIDLINNSAYDTDNNNGSSQEELKEKYESKIYREISGPLYLDVHSAALQLINLLKIYQSPFGASSLKSALARRPVSENRQYFETNPDKEELLQFLTEKIPDPSSSSEENGFQLKGSPFLYVDLKEELRSSLVTRDLLIPGALYTTKSTKLVEEFKMITSEKALTGCKKCIAENVKYLSVFWRNGQFYACLTLDKFVYDISDPEDAIPLMGGRESLDKYILKVAEGLSFRFTMFLNIRYTNMIHNTDSHFFPIMDGSKVYYEFDERNFRTPHSKGTKRTPHRKSTKRTQQSIGTKRKLAAMMESDSESDSEPDILLQQEYEAETDYDIKCTCADQGDSTGETVTSDREASDDMEVDVDVDVDPDVETDLIDITLFRDLFSSITESQETSDMQSSMEDILLGSHPSTSASETPVLAIQPFQRGESSSTVSEASPEKEIFYPRLTSKFEFSEEEFFRDIAHDHSEDMKKLLNMIYDCDYL